MTKAEKLVEELKELRNSIEEQIEQFKKKVEEAQEIGFSVFMRNLDAYVFEQLQEHIDNGNPYNQSLQSIIDGFEKEMPIENDEDDE